MRNTTRYVSIFLIVVLVIAISIWGPEAFASYKDRGILNKPHIELVMAFAIKILSILRYSTLVNQAEFV